MGRKEAEEEASRKFAEEAAQRAKKAEAKDSSDEDKDSDDSDESDSDDEAKEKAKQAAEKKRKLEEMKRQLEEEEAQLAAEAEAKKAKKKEKATKKTKTDEDGDEEKQTKNEAEVDEDVDPDAQHPEFKVAEVADVRPVKKKAGFFWYDLDVGDDDYLSSVSNYPNAKTGDKVIVAPAGSKVGGVKMKPSMIHGVHNECDLCGPKEMEWKAKGWQGKAALDCVILDSDLTVGSAAPAYVLPSSCT